MQHSDGRLVQESLIVSEYLDDLYTENKLIPSDPYAKANQKLLIERFSKVTTGFYKVLRVGDESSLKELGDFLLPFEAALNTAFFGGEKPALVDYMIWPWIEKFDFLISKNFEFDAVKYPNLFEYTVRMNELPGIKKLKIPNEIIQKFFASYLKGEEPDYDLGVHF